MIHVEQAIGFKPAEKFKLTQAELLANKAWSGTYLWDHLLAQPLAYTAGMTNEQVIARLRKHDFSHLTVFIYELPWYRRWSSEAAIEKQNGTIGLRRKFFSKDTAEQVTVRLCHECCHYAGFGHDGHPDPATDRSLPYTLERIVRRLLQ